MLTYYLVFYSTLYNGQVINNNIGHVILDETAATETQHIPITWENLNTIYNEYGLSCAFNIWNCRKGRKIEFFSWRSAIKEWKTTDSNLELRISYTPYNASIEEILKYHDGNKAIQYLVERGLTVVE